MGGLAEVPQWFDDTRRQAESELARLSPRRAGPERGDELSDRERAVLRLLTGDGSLREIADSIFVSHNTIKTQPAVDPPQAGRLGSRRSCHTGAIARHHLGGSPARPAVESPW
ncbi:MAG: LuxR C-terminal-related transcriptional regulator [Miltoncostaeaceae bacterium]